MDRAVAARHLGVEDVLAATGNEEMPGDINIKGDEKHEHTHVHNYPAAQPVQQVTQNQPTTSGVQTVEPTTKPKRKVPMWVPVALACIGLPMVGTAGVTAGAGGLALYNYFFNRPAAAATQSPNELGIKPGVQVTDKP